MPRLLGPAGLLLLLAAPLQAQENPRGFETWEVRAAPPSAPSTAVTTVHVSRRDYRYEGLALAGIAFGALGAWVGSQITEACPTEPGIDCSPDRLGNALALGLASAAVGGGLGYLVGRLSSKREPAPAGADTAP
jgi:hypothetical protein